MYIDKPVKDYIKCLGSRQPAPGGGSAAALTACLGVSLLSKVVNYTLGKPEHARDQARMRKLKVLCAKLDRQLIKLVDEDAIAYSQKNKKRSLGVPLEVCGFCFSAMQAVPDLAGKSNKNLASDLLAAAQLLEAAFSSAYVFVGINLKDKSIPEGKAIIKILERKSDIIRSIRRDAEVRIGKIIRG